MNLDRKIAIIEAIRVVERLAASEIGVIEGSRCLTRLADRTRAPFTSHPDDAFNLFIGIASETDHLPVGAERRNWADSALAAHDPNIDAYESTRMAEVKDHCRILLAVLEKMIVR
jgi:hypothetical protein